jgi:hypothetical protein
LILVIITLNGYAQPSIGKRDTVIITKLNLSKKSNAYSPVLHNNSLYFISDKQTNVGVLKWNEDNGNPTNVFYARRKDSLHFGRPALFKAINTKLNDGPVSFSKNQICYSSNCISENNAGRDIPYRLYSYSLNDKAATPKPIDMLVPDSLSILHPALVNDSLLYFAGVYKHSNTGADLYYCKRVNGVWLKPEKFGAPVNSKENDCFPFSKDGILYFSSDREGGKGGLDIYEFINGKLIKLEAVNSDKDDFGIYIIDELTGYFSSNRKGKDAIYYFNKINKPNFDICKKQVVNKYCYLFKEGESFDTHDTLNMIYEWDFGDGTKARGLTVKHCFPGEGKYQVKLNAIEKLDAETFYTDIEYELEVKNERQLYISSFDTVATDSLIGFETEYSNIPDFKPQKFYWDFGGENYYEGANVRYIFKKPGTYSVKLLAVDKGKIVGVYKTITVLNNYVPAKGSYNSVPLNFNKNEKEK